MPAKNGADLLGELPGGQPGQIGEGLKPHACITSGVSTASNSNLISRQVSSAPARLPCGWPAEPPPNCKTESSPKISTRAGMCQTWIPPDAAGSTAGSDAHSWSK